MFITWVSTLSEAAIAGIPVIPPRFIANITIESHLLDKVSVSKAKQYMYHGFECHHCFCA